MKKLIVSALAIAAALALSFGVPTSAQSGHTTGWNAHTTGWN